MKRFRLKTLLAVAICLSVLSGILVGTVSVANAAGEIQTVSGWTMASENNFQFTDDSGLARFKETKPTNTGENIDVIFNKQTYDVGRALEFDLYIHKGSPINNDFFLGFFMPQNITTGRLIPNTDNGTAHFNTKPMEVDGVKRMQDSFFFNRTQANPVTVSPINPSLGTSGKATIKIAFYKNNIVIHVNNEVLFDIPNIGRNTYNADTGKITLQVNIWNNVSQNTLFDFALSEVRDGGTLPLMVDKSTADFDNNDPKDIKVSAQQGSIEEVVGPNITAEDYTLSAGNVTIKKEYLATLPNGATDLTIKNSHETEGQQTLTVTASNFTRTLTSISVNAPTKVDYVLGQELDLAGGKVMATYNDRITDEIDITAAMVSGYNKNTLGQQTVTVTYEGITGTFAVNVTNEIVSISVTAPTKTNYIYGEDLDVVGGIIRITYSDNSTRDIDLTAAMVSGYNKNTLGTQTLTVTYEGKTDTFEVEVDREITEIIVTAPTKVNYIYDEDLIVTGGKVTVSYNNDTSEEIDLTANMISGYDKKKIGEQTLTVTYEGATATFKITVSNEVKSIAVTAPTKVAYKVNEELKLDGGKLVITFSDGSSEEIALTSAMISGYDKTKVGKQNVTVTYLGKTTTFTVNVEREEIEKSGCGSSVQSSIILTALISLMALAFVSFRKKKSN